MVIAKTAPAAALMLVCSLGASAQPMSSEERKQAIASLERSRDLLLSSIDGVSEGNAAKKPGADRWSVLECVEHLTLTERATLDRLQASLLKPESSDVEKALTRGKLEMVAKFMPDRSHRATAPVEIAPRGQFKTLAEAKAGFVAARTATIAFAAKTDAPLHSHVTKHMAFGELDGYQWFTLMAGHVERHVKQVNEVKATF